MERRRFLAGSALVGVSLSGCVALNKPPTAPACSGLAPPPRASNAPPDPRVGSVELPVPRSALTRGVLRNEIPAITAPRFASDTVDLPESLAPKDVVIGVARGGRARAYPLSTLAVHEVVNDEFDGPLLVTYCPLCASGLAAVRTVGNRGTVFGVSGLLYRANLVLYDRRTDSLWSQLLARAIRGPETGTSLSLVPSTMATWEAWQAAHPDSEVLLAPPDSGTISTVPEAMPVGVHGHVGVQEVGLSFDDDRLPRTALVVGVATEDEAMAYPVERVSAAGVVNDCVGALPVLVAGTSLPRAYDRRVDGEVLRFEWAGKNRLRGGGTIWSATTGRALSGAHEGAALGQPAFSTPMYWFAWLDFHPETAVFTG